MENVKMHLLIVAHLAAVLFAVPEASAAQTNTSPASEIVKEPGTETETKTVKSMWDLVRVGGAVMWALGTLALYGFYTAGAQIYVILFSNDRDKDKKFLKMS